MSRRPGSSGPSLRPGDADASPTARTWLSFERFAELGSVRQVWLWLRRERVEFPLQRFPGEVRWVEPCYHQVHSVLTNPVYAGAYASGSGVSATIT